MLFFFLNLKTEFV
uniref:Uncharacterized protein n=1 Tax=Anguilla anguilla TaxID=7936 RepID=A0A0E9XX73_ANGAN